MKTKMFAWMLTSLCATALMMSCGEKKEDGDDDDKDTEETGAPTGTGQPDADGDDTTVTMTGKLGLAGAALAPTDLSNLTLYCVSFEDPPVAATSKFGADGAFEVVLKKGVSFGCFVNDAEGATVANIVVNTGSEGALGGGAKSSLALSGDVNLGDLTIGANGKIEIPSSVLKGKESSATDKVAALDLDVVNGSTYKMTCLGDAEIAAKCKESLSDEGQPFSVFLRILKGSLGEEPVQAMGVWTSKEGFEACGSVDMTAAEKASIESEGFTISQAAVGDFTLGEGCSHKNADEDGYDPSAPVFGEDLDQYHAMSQLIENGNGYSFYTEDTDEHPNHDGNGTCVDSHSTAIEITGTSDEMLGAFSTRDVRYGCGDSDKEDIGVFTVKFTRVTE